MEEVKRRLSGEGPNPWSGVRGWVTPEPREAPNRVETGGSLAAGGEGGSLVAASSPSESASKG